MKILKANIAETEFVRHRQRLIKVEFPEGITGDAELQPVKYIRRRSAKCTGQCAHRCQNGKTSQTSLKKLPSVHGRGVRHIYFEETEEVTGSAKAT
jgi:hypothetical protein